MDTMISSSTFGQQTGLLVIQLLSFFHSFFRYALISELLSLMNMVTGQPRYSFSTALGRKSCDNLIHSPEDMSPQVTYEVP